MKRTSNTPYTTFPKVFKSGSKGTKLWENSASSINYQKPGPLDLNKVTVENYSKDKPAYLFPGHNYLGPGNKSRLEGNTAKPTTSADSIAADHDDDYYKAKTKEDVFSADRKAIGNFTVDAIKNFSIPSAVGAVGLGIKHGFESLTNNVVYPNLGKICRNHIGLGNIIQKMLQN